MELGPGVSCSHLLGGPLAQPLRSASTRVTCFGDQLSCSRPFPVLRLVTAPLVLQRPASPSAGAAPGAASSALTAASVHTCVLWVWAFVGSCSWDRTRTEMDKYGSPGHTLRPGRQHRRVAKEPRAVGPCGSCRCRGNPAWGSGTGAGQQQPSVKGASEQQYRRHRTCLP